MGVKNTPDVPRDINDWFSSITPRPAADAALSPAPPTTIIFLLKLNLFFKVSFKIPASSLPSTNTGIFFFDKKEADNNFSDHCLFLISIHNVPDASDISE